MVLSTTSKLNRPFTFVWYYFFQLHFQLKNFFPDNLTSTFFCSEIILDIFLANKTNKSVMFLSRAQTLKKTLEKRLRRQLRERLTSARGYALLPTSSSFDSPSSNCCRFLPSRSIIPDTDIISKKINKNIIYLSFERD